MFTDAAVRAVLDLHSPVTGHYKNRPDMAVCSYCTSGGDPFCYPDEAETFPCLTVKTVQKALESGKAV